MSYKVSTRKLRGKIVEDKDGYQIVDVYFPKDTPAYLRRHNLNGVQRAANAKIGDSVKLSYISAGSWALWCAEKMA